MYKFCKYISPCFNVNTYLLSSQLVIVFFFFVCCLINTSLGKSTHRQEKKIVILISSHHHHHVVRPAWTSLTLFLHVSLSFIVSGKSSGLHPVSSHSCCMYVRAGRPAFDWPYAGVHRSTSLTNLSLLHQQCPACLVRLAWIVFVIGGS